METYGKMFVSMNPYKIRAKNSNKTKSKMIKPLNFNKHDFFFATNGKLKLKDLDLNT